MSRIPHPDEVEQLPEIEKQWAVKAMHHAETYFKLISSIDVSTLPLTKLDDDLYDAFTRIFPEINVSELKQELFTTEPYKTRWREFIMVYEKTITDYNFGTLLRMDVNGDYTESNTMFVTRTQFFCIEVARNRKGLNKVHLKQQ
jgi:hypothetical protein